MSSSEVSELNTIKSVDKALEVLEAFSEISGGINLSSLSDKLKMNKSRVHRLLHALKQRGYVEQKSKNGKYHLGMTAFMVGQNIVSNMDLLRTAKPAMEELVRDCNETVYLSLRFGQEVLLFDKVDSLHPVNVMSLKGLSYPLTDCAAGEIFQVFDREEDALTDVCTSSVTHTRLETIKQQGYCSDNHRLGDGLSSLAVPLLNASKSVVGSLCFVGPDFRLSDEKVQSNLLIHLIDAGQAISARLGYLGYHLS